MKNIPTPFRKAGSPYLYYWEPQSNGTRRQRSTGASSMKRARAVIHERMKELEQDHSDKSFREYAEPYFTENDPRIHWKRLQNKSVGETYRKQTRAPNCSHPAFGTGDNLAPSRVVAPR